MAREAQGTNGQETQTFDAVLRAGFLAVLKRYARARPGEPFGRDHELRARFDELRDALASSDAVLACPTIKVRWSAGTGSLARIPSIALLDVRETRSLRTGLRCAFLFREDMSGVYLTLNQGVGERIDALGRAAARTALEGEAGRLQERFAELSEVGFRLDAEIDLRSSSPAARDYQISTVAHKLYPADAFPDDTAIEEDLSALLLAYTRYVAEKTDRDRVEPVTWIFQSNPKFYDLGHAVEELVEQTWLVQQYAEWIHAGDTVYLWEAGPQAGLVAVATILTDPHEIPIDDAQKPYASEVERVDGKRLRVRLRIDRVLGDRISRERLLEDPILSSLPITRLAQGTNFPVTREQATAIEALLERAGEAEAPAQRTDLRATLGKTASSGSAAQRSVEDEARDFDLRAAVDGLADAVARRGFVYEPWQLAAYVTALRTKPFVILAGVSGTGKSRLPEIVASATGGTSVLIPVRPDWTDSSDVIGYTDLNGQFRPGPFLETAREASETPGRHFVCILDEMNLARVEHYFAEVLSRIEERYPSSGGGYTSPPLLLHGVRDRDADWRRVGIPSNLSIVGTVNMDESTYGFSRKVLDRAFTIELAEIDLSLERTQRVAPSAETGRPWPTRVWAPRALQLGELLPLDDEERAVVERAIGALTELNVFLGLAQLRVGYRTRDEVALFLLHARDIAAAFTDSSGDRVDPLDLAIKMKILPRLAGGSAAIRRIVLQMLGWAHRGKPYEQEQDAEGAVAAWLRAGTPGAVAGARFPRTTARLCLMWERLLDEGYTSYWV